MFQRAEIVTPHIQFANFFAPALELTGRKFIQVQKDNSQNDNGLHGFTAESWHIGAPPCTL